MHVLMVLMLCMALRRVHTVASLQTTFLSASSLAVTVIRLVMHMVFVLSLTTGFCKVVTNMN